MKLHTTDPIPALSNARIVYVISNQAVKLLLQRHFQGRGKPVAGNFAIWDTPLAAFNALYHEIESHVIASIKELVAEREQAVDFSLELKLERAIGWSCAQPLDRFDGVTFEFGPLSSRRTAWIVPSGHQDLRAPLTNLVTITYQIRRGRGGRSEWLCSIINFRPGKDLGVDTGNLSFKTGCAFFRFGHPGEPLA